MFEKGQLINFGSRSINVTSTFELNRRIYLAQVDPPKPPPTITTRPAAGVGTYGLRVQYQMPVPKPRVPTVPAMMKFLRETWLMVILSST